MFVQIVIVRRFVSAFLDLVLRVGEVDHRFGMLDPMYQSFEGLFQLLRVNAELNMKCKSELATLLEKSERLPVRADAAGLLHEREELRYV